MIKKLVFYHGTNHDSIVAGGQLFMLGLSSQLAKSAPNYEVYYIGRHDQKVKEAHYDTGLNLIDIETCNFAQFDGADFFVPFNYIAMFLEDVSMITAGRILTYCWHPNQTTWFVDQFYDPAQAKKDVFKLLKDTTSVCFMDFSCFLSTNTDTQYKFDKTIVPIFSSSSNQSYYNVGVSPKKTNCETKRVNIGWMSRLDGDKMPSLVNLIDNLYDIDDLTDTEIWLHVIGDGDRRRDFSLHEYSSRIRFVFTSYLFGDERNNYIKENIDVMVVMGMSALDVAELSVPTVVPICESHNFKDNKFVYLFDTKNFSLGWTIRELGFLWFRQFTIGSIIQHIYIEGKKQEYGERCANFVRDNFSAEKSAECFWDALQNTTLTIDDCRKNKSLIAQSNAFRSYKRFMGKSQDYHAFINFVRKTRNMSKAKKSLYFVYMFAKRIFGFKAK